MKRRNKGGPGSRTAITPVPAATTAPDGGVNSAGPDAATASDGGADTDAQAGIIPKIEEVTMDNKSTTNDAAPRQFLTMALPNGAEIGVRTSAVEWYMSSEDNPEQTLVKCSGTDPITVPLSAKHFAARMRQVEKR